MTQTGQPEHGSTPTSDNMHQTIAQQQTDGQSRTLLVKVDERNMDTSYANAFRTHTTAEEVMIDFGVNLLTPAPEGGQNADGQILFSVKDRLVLNYWTVKRLALTLSQIVRQHEEQFGTLELDAAERMKK